MSVCANNLPPSDRYLKRFFIFFIEIRQVREKSMYSNTIKIISDKIEKKNVYTVFVLNVESTAGCCPSQKGGGGVESGLWWYDRPLPPAVIYYLPNGPINFQ